MATFDTVAEAEKFRDFLRSDVWTSNPVLAGTPQTRILQAAPAQ